MIMRATANVYRRAYNLMTSGEVTGDSYLDVTEFKDMDEHYSSATWWGQRGM